MGAKSRRTKEAKRRETCRRVRRYHERRAALISRLGGACVDCKEAEAARLEFDHVEGRDWVCRDKSRWARIVMYEREAAAGLIVLRCGKCNRKRGNPRRVAAGVADEPLPD